MWTALGDFPSLSSHTCGPVSRHWESGSSWAFSLAISFKDLCEKGLSIPWTSSLWCERPQFQLCPCSSLLRKEAKTTFVFKISWSYWCNQMLEFTCPNFASVPSFSVLKCATLGAHWLSEYSTKLTGLTLSAACSYFCCSIPLLRAYSIVFW